MKSLWPVLFVLSVTFFISGCSDDNVDPKTMGVEAYAKTLDSTVSSTDFSSKYTAEIHLSQAMTWGTKQDWNTFAGEVARVGQKLLVEKPEVQRIFIKAYDGNFDWAMYVVKRDALPKGWQNASYLQFFSFGQVTSGSAQANQTLCDFYQSYESSRPADSTCR